MVGENRARYGAHSTGQCRIMRACAGRPAAVSSRQMPTLGQLLEAHPPVLLLDASSTRVQVGWLPGAGLAGARWAGSDEEAGTGIFRAIEELGVDVGQAGAFIFCDGPGSTLGVRTTAVALRTWQVIARRPVYAYHSLSLVAQGLNKPEATIIADARRDLWHALQSGGALRRAPAAELRGELITPDNFRHWSPLPPGTVQVPYVIAELLPRVVDQDLFRQIESPDAFLHEEPAYATWTAQIHRAPGARSP